jgi:hypothetical protein
LVRVPQLAPAGAMLMAETTTAPPIAASATMIARTRFFVEDFLVQPQAPQPATTVCIRTTRTRSNGRRMRFSTERSPAL